MKNLFGLFGFSCLLILLLFNSTQAVPVSTAFTYQGRLTENGQPAEGVYDLQFRLFDAVTGGSQVGVAVIRGDITVTKGLFTVSDVDFGSGIFNGEARWIEISVRPGGSTGSFTPLLLLQPITATPYAIYALAGPGASTGGWVDYGSAVSLATNADRVGIGISDPSAELHVKGSGWVQGVFESNDSSGGIQLIAQDPTPGVSGGKYELQALKDGGFILYDRNNGRYVMNVLANGNVGFGMGNPTGKLQAETSSNVVGHTLYGLYGKSSGNLGSNYGVYGESSSILGGTNFGVYGKSSGNLAGGKGYAVYGENTGTGYAGYFLGDGYFSGNLRLGTSSGIEFPDGTKQATAYRGFPGPNYDSGWIAIVPGQAYVKNHNLGGNVDNYVVDLQFKDVTGQLGIHNIGIGGNGTSGGRYSALNENSITVYRYASDSYIDLFRVRIWVYE
jgi:hypothetical protein